MVSGSDAHNDKEVFGIAGFIDHEPFAWHVIENRSDRRKAPTL